MKTIEQRTQEMAEHDRISEQVKTLDGLRELFRERYTAAYDRGERLSEWIVLGLWSLDTCGNAMFIHEVNHQPGSLKDLFPDWPDVITAEEANVRLKEQIGPYTRPDQMGQWLKQKSKPVTRQEIENWLVENSYPSTFAAGIGGMFGHLPPEDQLCPRCKQGWTIENHQDCALTSRSGEDRIYMHHACIAAQTREKTAAEIKECLETAGFTHYSMSAIANGYEPLNSGPLTEPWYKVELHWDTQWRHLIIGWRKRVIHLGWENVQQDIEAVDIMGGDDKEVTHFEQNCHCWGYEKLTQYLTKLKELL